MSVRHPDAAWAAYAKDRAKVAALMAGREAAKAYICALPGHSEATQAKYREGAYFLPMTARTSEAFGGLVFARTPSRTTPTALDALLSDVTRTGQDVDRFAEMAFDAVLQTHTICVLIDYPAAPAGLTVQEAEAQGFRPFATLYTADDILAARYSGAGSARQLSHVRLVERVEEPCDEDEWAVESVEQVRVLDLDDAGRYRQRIFRQVMALDGKRSWQQWGDTIEPRAAGERLRVIPAFFCNPRDAEPRPGPPPLRDIADINIAHFNDSAAYQWGIIWTANPTPVLLGFDFGEGHVVELGSSRGLTGPDTAKASYLEFTGGGLSELRLSMDAKRRDGAMIGARLLLEESKAAVAAETARIQRAGETSVIAGIANAVSECLTKALTLLAQWAGIEPTTPDGPLEYWLNTDLNPTMLTGPALTALLGAWQAGALTEQELFANLQRAEIIDPATNFADHKEQLDQAGQALGTIADGNSAGAA